MAETPGPEPGTPLDQAKLSIGVIDRPHGVKGEMQVRLTTDYPEHFTKTKRLFLGDEPSARRVLGIRFHKEKALIRLEGITTPEQVRAISGTPVRIYASEAKPLEEGEYFYFQLIGSRVVTETGETLGTLIDILETGANEVYVVSPPEGKETILLPNIPSVILSIDETTQTIVVRPLEYA
jgi:16S rRNA processing protein RimM